MDFSGNINVDIDFLVDFFCCFLVEILISKINILLI